MGTTTAKSLRDAFGAPPATNQLLNHVTPDR